MSILSVFLQEKSRENQEKYENILKL